MPKVVLVDKNHCDCEDVAIYFMLVAGSLRYLLSLLKQPLNAAHELTWKQKSLISLWYLGSDCSYR